MTIDYLEEIRVVRLVRSAKPFGNARATAEELGGWVPALDGIDTTQYGVLLDFRLTAMTSDPDILRMVVVEVDRIAMLFPRRAILLTAVLLGVQSERVAQAGGRIEPFIDEAAAWEHVKG